MAETAAVLVRSLAGIPASTAKSPANGSQPPAAGFDAAALRLEAIHLLLLILQVPPLDEVNTLRLSPNSSINIALARLVSTRPCAQHAA